MATESITAKQFITTLSQAHKLQDLRALWESVQACPEEVLPKPDLSKVPPSLLSKPLGIGHAKDQPDILASDIVLSFLNFIASSIDGKTEIGDEALATTVCDAALTCSDIHALDVSVTRPMGGWTKGEIMITLQGVNFITFAARQRATRVSPDDAQVCMRHDGMPYFSTDLKTGPVVSKVFASLWVDVVDGHYFVKGVGTAYANETGTKPCVYWSPLFGLKTIFKDDSPGEDAIEAFLAKVSDWLKKVESEGVWALSSL